MPRRTSIPSPACWRRRCKINPPRFEQVCIKLTIRAPGRRTGIGRGNTCSPGVRAVGRAKAFERRRIPARRNWRSGVAPRQITNAGPFGRFCERGPLARRGRRAGHPQFAKLRFDHSYRFCGSTRENGFLQRMALRFGQGANRSFRDRSPCRVPSSRGTDGKGGTLEILEQVWIGQRIRILCRFFVFERPLLHRAVDLLQVCNARIEAGGRAGLDKIRHCHDHQR